MSAPSPTERVWKVIIVGSGPAGSATAIALANREPELARQTLILERAAHPRVKLCGGGVTPLADEQLAALDVRADVPAVPVARARFVYDGYGLEIHAGAQPLFRVVDRRLFDHALVREAQARGVTLRERERVTGVEIERDGVVVEGRGGRFRADVLVAADGAKSVVRRRTVSEHPSRISRLMEILTPEAPSHPLFADRTAIFDFSALRQGVQGYTWNFPSLRDARPVMNRGIFDSRVVGDHPRADLRAALAAFLRPEHDLESFRLEGHPERWYDPLAIVHRPRLLFVGEAAGIEPFAGEGIGFALGYGRLAAEAIARAFRNRRFDFHDYPVRLRRSAIGRSMRRRQLVARVFYRLRSRAMWRIGFWLSRPIVRRMLPSDTRIVPLTPTR